MTASATYVIFPLFAFFALAGAISDATSRTIPNLLNLGFLIAGLACSFAFNGLSLGLSALGHFLIALIIGMVLFRFGLWGGGDAKFYAATATWFALPQFFALILAISLVGLVLVLGMFAAHRARSGKDRKKMREVPYGIAIALGGMITMTLNQIGHTPIG